MIKHILTLIWNKRKQNLLLFLEIFLAFVILFGVFSFVVENYRLYNTPLGFETDDVWIVNFNLEDFKDSTEMVETKERLYHELMAKPEIVSVAWVGWVNPFGNSVWITSNDDNDFELSTHMAYGDIHYAESAGLNIIEGRWFNESDELAKYPPVVITKRLRDKYFKDVSIFDSVYVFNEESKVVGVVDHFKYQGEFSEEEPLTFFYAPSHSEDLPNLNLRLRQGTTTDFEEELNKTIASITKRNNFLIEKLENRRIRESRATWIPIIALLSISGFLILNVALGLFGVLWYNINKRRAEIGLRRTLGATQGNVTRQFVVEVFLVAFFGVLLGAFFAVQVPFLLKEELLKTENFYLGILFSSILIFVLVIICAFYPSRQASLIHPAVALHEE